MSKTLIRNARIVDPAQGLDKTGHLLIERGKIAELYFGKAAPEQPGKVRTIDAKGLIVCPGLVDLCARIRIPRTDSTQQLEKELRAAVAGGVTHVVCPPDTRPIIDLPSAALLEIDLANSVGLAEVHPLGAATVGLEGTRLTDMAMLKEAGCIGISNALNPIENTLVARRAMQYAATYDIPIFLTPFDPYLQGNGAVHEGAMSTKLGLPAIPEAAETVAVARDIALIETTGVRAHFQFLSCARSLDMVREAQGRGLPITASVAAHHLHLSENDIGDFDTLYKVIPPLRSDADRAALREGIADRTLTSLCSDHQSRSRDGKLAPVSEASTGIIGLQTLLPLTLRLVDENVCDLSTALSLITSEPAARIGLDKQHQIKAGNPANLCLFDPQATWSVNRETLYSRGVNSPFLDATMKGRVLHTFHRGKQVYAYSD